MRHPSRATNLRPPKRSSPSCSSTATARARTNPTRAPCRTRRPCSTALIDIFDAFVATLGDTRLEPDLENLLWGAVNLFHRAADRAQRDLDDNELSQRRSQDEQDGSEIRSLELERLIAEGISQIERRNAFEVMRDHAAELFELHTGSAWTPRAGSMVNHKALTSAVIDSRDFLAAKRRAETEVMMPEGTRIAFAGGLDCNDHRAIWDALDRARAKHPDMVLLHGGSPKGAERIAACWAEKRKVAAARLQAGLDPARQGRALPAQRPAPRDDAQGRHRLSRLRDHREPRRQGPPPRHPGLAVRRRFVAPLLPIDQVGRLAEAAGDVCLASLFSSNEWPQNQLLASSRGMRGSADRRGSGSFGWASLISGSLRLRVVSRGIYEHNGPR